MQTYSSIHHQLHIYNLTKITWKEVTKREYELLNKM